MIIHTKSHFDAAHYLKGYKGKCSNLHGHRWEVEMWVEGDRNHLDKCGIMFDFTELKNICDFFDHKCINELMKNNPTAENICLKIVDYLEDKYGFLKFRIRVYESPDSWAEEESGICEVQE